MANPLDFLKSTNYPSSILEGTFGDKFYKNVVEPAKLGTGPKPTIGQVAKNWNPFKAFTPKMLATGPTPAASKFLGSNVAYGLPLAYASMASSLQKNLEEKGLTGEGGIADVSGLWGAEAAGADVEYDIPEIGELHDYWEGIYPERGEADWEKYMRDQIAEKGTIVPDKRTTQMGMFDISPQKYLLNQILGRGIGYLRNKFQERQRTKKAHADLMKHITEGKGGRVPIETKMAKKLGERYGPGKEFETVAGGSEFEYDPTLQTLFKISEKGTQEKIKPPTRRPYVSPARPHGNGGGGGGGMGKGRDPGGGTAGSPFYEGGRVGFSKGGIVDLWQELSSL